MKRRSTLASGFHHFVKEGGYPLPVNSVFLNTSNESAYPGAKKSIKIDWKCRLFLKRKDGFERKPIIRVQTTPRCVTGRFVQIHALIRYHISDRIETKSYCCGGQNHIFSDRKIPVSYTHLTLPTILLV